MMLAPRGSLAGGLVEELRTRQELAMLRSATGKLWCATLCALLRCLTLPAVCIPLSFSDVTVHAAEQAAALQCRRRQGRKGDV